VKAPASIGVGRWALAETRPPSRPTLFGVVVVVVHREEEEEDQEVEHTDPPQGEPRMVDTFREDPRRSSAARSASGSQVFDTAVDIEVLPPSAPVPPSYQPAPTFSFSRPSGGKGAGLRASGLGLPHAPSHTGVPWLDCAEDTQDEEALYQSPG
jgi:hypothetical protein